MECFVLNTWAQSLWLACAGELVEIRCVERDHRDIEISAIVMATTPHIASFWTIFSQLLSDNL